ncbi:MAG: LVIVD repeat-containing protein [Thermoplasmatota archaeon]
MRPFATLLLIIALSGCVAPTVTQRALSLPPTTGKAADLPPNWYAAALAHGSGHDHRNILEHANASTPNFHLLGHDPLLTDHYGGKPAFAYGCGEAATTASGRRLDVIDAFQNDLSFVLEDVTNASHPVKVGEFYSQGMPTYDADITPDGLYVVLAFDGLVRTPVASPLGVPAAPLPDGANTSAVPSLHFVSACGEHQTIALPDAVAASQGVVLVSVADPTHPTFVDWSPTPGFNLHSVSTARVDNVDWVAGSVLTGTQAGSYFTFYQIQDTPAGTKLVPEGIYESPPVTQGEGGSVFVPITNGHTDVSFQKDPTSGKLLGYVADWEGGVIVIDLSSPGVARAIGSWAPHHATPIDPADDGPCYPGAVHEVLAAPTLWNGKHYIFAGQECPGKTSTSAPGGSVFVLDATDPTNLKLVGSWHLPEDTGVWTVEYQASPHYLALVNRTLFVSDYHAGLWAVDVSNDSLLASPPSIGVYLPAIPPPVPPAKKRYRALR